jgi:hypothetical protein
VRIATPVGRRHARTPGRGAARRRRASHRVPAVRALPRTRPCRRVRCRPADRSRGAAHRRPGAIPPLRGTAARARVPRSWVHRTGRRPRVPTGCWAAAASRPRPWRDRAPARTHAPPPDGRIPASRSAARQSRHAVPARAGRAPDPAAASRARPAHENITRQLPALRVRRGPACTSGESASAAGTAAGVIAGSVAGAPAGVDGRGDTRRDRAHRGPDRMSRI